MTCDAVPGGGTPPAPARPLGAGPSALSLSLSDGTDAALLHRMGKATDTLALVDERRRDVKINERATRNLLRSTRTILACAPQEMRPELLEQIATLERLLRGSLEDHRRLDECERNARACLAEGAREMGRLWGGPRPRDFLSNLY